MKPSINIIAVGGLKEAYLSEAAKSYANQLQKVCSLTVTELPDEPVPEYQRVLRRHAILAEEGERVLNCLKPSDIKAMLAIEGRLGDLSFFSDLINKAASERRHLDFIIGGSLGLAESVLLKSDYKISLSRLTFPHRLTRLLLLEVLCQVLVK